MNIYRCAALTLVTCAAALSLAACSAGITSATTAPPTQTQTPAPARSATASQSAVAGTTVSVGGPIGSFPIPTHAKVVENITEGNETVILLGSVSPSEVSSFYAAALPRAGYKITMNTLATMNNETGAAIEFTGHGYKGTIGADSNLATTGVSVGGVNGKNFVGITLTKK